MSSLAVLKLVRTWILFTIICWGSVHLAGCQRVFHFGQNLTPDIKELIALSQSRGNVCIDAFPQVSLPVKSAAPPTQNPACIHPVLLHDPVLRQPPKSTAFPRHQSHVRPAATSLLFSSDILMGKLEEHVPQFQTLSTDSPPLPRM